MPGGELSAMFEGLSADAEEAAGNISESLATLGEKTAENEESSLSNSLENEAKTAKTFTDIREGTDVETGTEPSSVPAAEEAPGEPASGAGEGEPPASGGAPASTADMLDLLFHEFGHHEGAEDCTREFANQVTMVAAAYAVVVLEKPEVVDNFR